MTVNPRLLEPAGGTASGSAHPGEPVRKAGPRWSSNVWMNFALRRAGGLLLSLFLLVVVTFMMVPLIPGDPARAIAGTDASPETLARLRAQMGLDDPLPVRFLDYVAGLARFDLGNSFRFNDAVADIVATKLPYTAQLAFMAIAVVLLVAVPAGMAVGVLSRGGRRRWLDLAFGNVAGFLASLPGYVTATLLVVVFAIMLPIFPAGGADSLSALVLPTLALAIGPTCAVARVVRQETGAVLEQDYMRTARGRRIPPVRLYLRHALPNLLTSTLTLTGLILASLLGGAIIIETVFNYPGLGSEIIQAIIYRDYPLIQGIILVVGLIATLLNLLVDVVLGIIDPRTLGAKSHG
ncbi:dipeptide/oligopeptide/nickel ABC transporter permease [Arthrobacter crystallopoietes BAB-32]|uniref:Dipeptide/oligopeptide/nickel ABC transporter permease n=1 Tax=Arthrobacter crystallopoietes BAB-32 TaxID=1246476 RepID=N1V3A9_9MICC|nr:ABC transporter permease [Arthrobacter crystallopoietes]EMY35795.1 dipeptide/oligopeptide/nickel ABC transporter permease [Arthrobacter crystallopoietes BAB-32]